MKEIEKAYLAGIIDARAHINAYFSPRKVSARGFFVMTQIVITTTKERLKQFLRKSRLSWRFNEHTKGCKDHQMTISSLEETRFLLKLVLPYLIVHKDVAELMLEFYESRLAGRSDGGKYSPYTDVEIELIEKIKTINQR